jgi:hypothetical protein
MLTDGALECSRQRTASSQLSGVPSLMKRMVLVQPELVGGLAVALLSARMSKALPNAETKFVDEPGHTRPTHCDLGETGSLSQGVQEGRKALRILHIHGM